MLRIKS